MCAIALLTGCSALQGLSLIWQVSPTSGLLNLLNIAHMGLGTEPRFGQGIHEIAMHQYEGALDG